MRTRLLLMAAPALLLGGCEHGPDGGPYMGGPDNFGEANRQTMLAQVVDPAPVYDTAVPETSAEHASQATGRYHAGKVKIPDRVRTSTMVESSSRENGSN